MVNKNGAASSLFSRCTPPLNTFRNKECIREWTPTGAFKHHYWLAWMLLISFVIAPTAVWRLYITPASSMPFVTQYYLTLPCSTADVQTWTAKFDSLITWNQRVVWCAVDCSTHHATGIVTLLPRLY
uniref:Uncharacterized protein n=1 Tax=Eutreptiella gymnastica TaxID=73025 RepID=A0A7S1IDZ0_9EUGL|mmetsp:Transcript_150371/g.262758  ORF Transcript_150371/g.262758 Transcript_150371/m.262758 type:complete len:127 (+) Transcript_150371:105-485(+)